MRNEREDYPDLGRFITQEALPTLKDIILEPIRFSQALKERLTDATANPDYENLDRKTKALVQVRDYMWSYLPVEAPIAMASGLVMQGNVAAGLLLGSGVWVFLGAVLRYVRSQEQS